MTNSFFYDNIWRKMNNGINDTSSALARKSDYGTYVKNPAALRQRKQTLNPIRFKRCNLCYFYAENQLKGEILCQEISFKEWCLLF